MKNERLFEALEKIDEELIDEAAPGNKPPKKKAKTATWVKWGAMAACALVIVGIGAPLLFNHSGAVTGGNPEEPQLEGNITEKPKTTEDEAGEGETNLVTLTHMEEIRVRIDELFPDGFRGTIEVGTDLFKEGEQITIVAQDNVTVVQKDGSIFSYDELEPNIPDSDLAIGSYVWVGFQKYDYLEGNGKYNQIFAYHVEAEGNNRATDNEVTKELSIEDAVTDVRFGDLFPKNVLDGYEMQEGITVYGDEVLVVSYYNKELEDELTIRIASKKWFYNQQSDLKLDTVMYREKNSGVSSYIYIAGGENIVQYTFSKTDIADNEKFFDMVYSATYFGECIDYPDIDVNE